MPAPRRRTRSSVRAPVQDEEEEVHVQAVVSESVTRAQGCKVTQAVESIEYVEKFVFGEGFGNAKAFEVQTQLELLDMAIRELRELGEGVKYMERYMRLKSELNKKYSEEQAQAFPGNVTVQTKAEMPKFSGAYADWKDFENAFKLDVHMKKGSDAEKLRKLGQCLSGRPKDLISKYDLLGENAYKEAWDDLKRHYCNSAEAFAEHVCAIFKQDRIKQGDAEGIRSLIGKVEASVKRSNEIVAGEDALGHAAAAHVITLMDAATREQWRLNRVTTEKLPTLDEVSRFCLAKAKTWAENSGEVSVRHDKGGEKVKMERRSNNYEEGPSKMRRLSCYKCDAQHYLRECPRFQSDSAAGRDSFVKKNLLCRKCFAKHPLAGCRSTFDLCNKCTDPHHVMLCPK